MTKKEIKSIVLACRDERKLCRFYMKYDENYFYYFPLLSNDKYFLGIEEDDFMLNGYSVRRFRDVIKAEIRDDDCLGIDVKEGIVDSIIVPDVDITDWRTLLSGLQKAGRNIIIEHESFDEDDEYNFFIGRIEKVCKDHVYLRHFDSDGLWDDVPTRIGYPDITSVSFGTRYVDVFSKYLPPLPNNFGKTV